MIRPTGPQAQTSEAFAPPVFRPEKPSAPAPERVDQVDLGRAAPVLEPRPVAAAAPAAAAPSVEATPLRAAFDRILNAGGPGQARLLDDNASAWNARWRMVESAKQNFNAQYFCWDSDVFGLSLMGHLYQKVQRDGVKGRIMVDATGDTFGTRGFKSHLGGKDYLQELVGTGRVEAKVYHPHYKKVIDQFFHMSSTYAAASNHDKILEVDGERGITGGRNIGFEYYVHPDDFSGAWRDTDIEMVGRPAAMELREAFEVEFGAPWINDAVKPDRFGNWMRRDLELVGAYVLMDQWLKGSPLSEADMARLRDSKEARAEQAAVMVQEAVRRLPSEGIAREPGSRELRKLRKLAMELAGYPHLRGSANQAPPPQHDAEIKILDKTSSVGTGQDSINRTLLDLSRTAQKRIVIENPYVVLTEDTLEALREAGKRGVEIWLGTNSPSSTDSAVTQAFFLNDWPEILATVPNLHIFVATGTRKLHAKVATLDDTVTLVSSFNLDFLSSQVNSEVAAAVWSPDFARQTYQGILKDHSDPRNGAVEYKIKRDAQGVPVRSDGLPVLDDQGRLVNRPEIEFGPADHLEPEVLKAYEKKMRRWNWLREHIPQLRPLMDRFSQDHGGPPASSGGDAGGSWLLA